MAATSQYGDNKMTTSEQLLRAAIENGTAKILTLQAAKELKGKRIAVISFGYRDQYNFSEFVVGEIKSQYEWAKSNIAENWKPFNNQAEYWDSYMTKEQLEEQQTNMLLYDADGKTTYFLCHTKYWNLYNEPTFVCSDADRTVMFVEIKTVSLLKVNYIIGRGPNQGRKAQQFFNCSLDAAKSKSTIFKNHEFLSSEMVDLELDKNDYFGSDGMLRTHDHIQKPDSYQENRDWNEFYQRSTGNPLPKGGVL